jgi:2,3-bisphosphoglycerate-independent phosphoglycerate mutase
VIFLGDGMADFPVPELGNRTPLQAARKPEMDRIAREGRCGQFVTVEDDLPPGSEVANLVVMGYDPYKVYQGRGVIEAASMGVDLAPTDVGMRCNLICLEDGKIKNHSSGHISTEEGCELISFIDARLGSPSVRFHPGISYRHLLVLKQVPTSDAHFAISNFQFPVSNETGLPSSFVPSAEIECSPPHDHVGEPFRDLMVRPLKPAAEPTARLLNDLILRSQDLLPSHPINVRRKQEGKDQGNSIWPWSPGHKPKMATFRELYGLTGAVISAVDLIQGLGIYAGLDVIKVPGATGFIDTNYEGKADACLAALRDHDFVYVHVEASDEAGHSRNVKEKVLAIEYLDQRLIKRVMAGIEAEGIQTVIALLPDHATPVGKGNHVHGPVPVAIRDPRFPPDQVTAYDEESVKSGALGIMHGRQFFTTFLG